MPEQYPTNEAAIAQGLTQGVAVGQSINQMWQQKRAQDFEKDYKAASVVMTIAGTKGISPEYQAELINSKLVPMINKWYPESKLKPFEASSADSIKLFVSDLSSINSNEKLSPDVKQALSVKRIQEFAAEQQDSQRIIDTQLDLTKSNVARADAMEKAKLDASKEVTDKEGQKVDTLRKEFIKGSESFNMVADAWNRMKEMGNTKDAQGDMALLYSYIKMLDPTSVVREGEYATAADTAGIPQQVVQMYNKAVAGKTLEAGVRSSFVKKGKVLYEGALSRHRQYEGEMRKKATQEGIQDPSRVIIDYVLKNPDVKPDPTKDVPNPSGKKGGAQPQTAEAYLESLNGRR